MDSLKPIYKNYYIPGTLTTDKDAFLNISIQESLIISFDFSR